LAVSDYCGFDDALELQRMTFQDPGTLAADMGTVLFNSFKYRPGMMTLNRLTFRVGDHRAAAFRIRNVLSHMLITVTLYGVGMMLFDSIQVAAIGALLFGLNPLMNQAVAGAVWVIAPANLCLILSFFLFLLSLRAPRHNILMLTGSLVIGSAGILIYDPVIVLYGLIYVYLVVWIFVKRKKHPGTGYLATLLGFTVVFLGVWFSLRARYLPPGAQHPVVFGTAARNLAIYVAAPFQFVDPVLANHILDTPLPPEALAGHITPELLVVVLFPPLVFVWLIVYRLHALRKNLTRDDLANFIFLILAWGGSLLPYLTLNDHPSETYNYVGFLMVALIFSRLLHAGFIQNGTTASRGAYAAVIATIVVLYISGIAVKNKCVYGCGQAFGRVLATLPANKLQDGKWEIVFANVPGEPATRAYGMYGYKGIDTLGIGAYGSVGIKDALQFAFHNPEIGAESVDAQLLGGACNSHTSGQLCFWVHSDGQVEEAAPGQIGRAHV
jgi:4-amino-4-deoxy-L-arabinose transferase-like glycosyltransferase